MVQELGVIFILVYRWGCYGMLVEVRVQLSLIPDLTSYLCYHGCLRERLPI